MPIYTRNGQITSLFSRDKEVTTVYARNGGSPKQVYSNASGGGTPVAPTANWAAAEALNSNFGLPAWSATRSYYPMRNTSDSDVFNAAWSASDWGGSGPGMDFYVFIPNDGLYTNTPIVSAARMFEHSTQSRFNDPDAAFWDVSTITNMQRMFYTQFGPGGLFNQDISGWNVSSVTDMSFMFFRAGSFNQDISGWNVSSVTDMSSMFGSASAFNQPLNTWNMTGVSNLGGMFLGALAFDQPLNNWDTSDVTSMNDMFNGANAFNQDIGSWDVSNVTTFQRMFLNNTAFNNGGSPNINNWDTGVTVAVQMFQGATAFNQPIGGWDTSGFTRMDDMFRGATAFNQDISGWDVSNVTNMNYMFNLADAFDQDLSGWNVDGVGVVGFSLDADQREDNGGGWTEAEHPSNAFGNFYNF